MSKLDPAYLLHKARQKAGLTQRKLAERADTSQSVVARIESGVTNPTIKTFNHLINAAGFELETELVVRPVEGSHMLEDVARILQLSPEERLQETKTANKFITASRHV